MHDPQPWGRERGRHGEGGPSGGHQSTVTICLRRQGHILVPKAQRAQRLVPSARSVSCPQCPWCTARSPYALCTVSSAQCTVLVHHVQSVVHGTLCMVLSARHTAHTHCAQTPVHSP